jgi:four helix bundle protein
MAASTTDHSWVPFEEWERNIPTSISDDALWKMKIYRLALYLGDISWSDVTTLIQDRRTIALSDQLYRAVGSISANYAEGFSRSTGKDRARFFEYALGSARESRDWYYKSRHILEQSIIQHRLQLLADIIRILLTIIPNERTHSIREGQPPYMLEEF